MKRLNTYLRGFRNDDQGSIAIETIILLPMLFWAYLTMFSVFDAYRQHATTQKAAYTIADVISRETNPLDDAYLNGTREMLAYLTGADVSNVALRVTSVRYNANQDTYQRDWSEADGSTTALTNSQVGALEDDLPILPHNERIMVVETFVNYHPPFNIGLGDREIHNFVFTRPRYAPQVCFLSCN